MANQKLSSRKEAVALGEDLRKAVCNDCFESFVLLAPSDVYFNRVCLRMQAMLPSRSKMKTNTTDSQIRRKSSSWEVASLVQSMYIHMNHHLPYMSNVL